jgi:hypothetical protein
VQTRSGLSGTTSNATGKTSSIHFEEVLVAALEALPKTTCGRRADTSRLLTMRSSKGAAAKAQQYETTNGISCEARFARSAQRYSDLSA